MNIKAVARRYLFRYFRAAAFFENNRIIIFYPQKYHTFADEIGGDFLSLSILF